MRKLQKVIALFCLFGAAACGVCGTYMFFRPEPEATRRQETEESLADRYILQLLEQQTEEAETTIAKTEEKTADTSTSEMEVPESTEAALTEISETESETTRFGTEIVTVEVPLTWADDNWYMRDGITYTPDYARGTIMGVLEVPLAKIRRGFYTGTWSDIAYNLDIWMITAARPDYVLGKTHICIYGHNHTVQDLSFNRLKYVRQGEVFTITDENGVYVYDVTDFFADWRECVSTNLVNNFNISPDKCYIITCGRDEYRYKDIVVEGTLREVVPLDKYADYELYRTSQEESAEEISETEISEEASAENETTEPEDSEESREEETETNLVATAFRITENADGGYTVTVTDSDGNLAKGKYLLGNEDGIFLEQWEEASHRLTTDIQTGRTYVIGVFSPDAMEGGFLAPEDVTFIKQKEKAVAQIVAEQTPQRNAIEEFLDTQAGRYAYLGASLMLALIIAAVAIKLWRSSNE